MEQFLQRYHKRLWGGVSALLGIAVLICAVVDLAVTGGLSWTWYVIGAAGYAWGVLSALLMGGRRRIALGAATGCLLAMPLLLLIERLSPMTGWAWPVGFPIICVTLVCALAGAGVFKIEGVSGWTRAALIVLCALPVTAVSNVAVAAYLGTSIAWTLWPNLAGGLLCAAALFAVGRVRRVRTRAA